VHVRIPARFRDAIENEPADQPDYVWLEHAVCALGETPCGWIIGAVFKKTVERHATATGDLSLPADDSQRCPRCGSVMFRSGHARRLDLAADQTPPLRPGIDYEVADDIEYV
jgi:hypothetical protein